MKLLKRMAVLSLVVLALGGCTKSSISTDAPVSGSEEVDPAKMETDDDETLPRDQNFLVEDETVETTMYDWEQAQSECDGLFVSLYSLKDRRLMRLRLQALTSLEQRI